MPDLWEIAKHYLDEKETKWMYVLKKTNRPSFLSECFRTDRHRARRIEKTARQVFERGTDWARKAEVIKNLHIGKCKVSVCEVRINGTVIRVAAYMHKGRIPIYLFDFNTHSGSKNNIPDHFLNRAADTATIAESCAKEYDFSEYGDC